MKSCHTRQKSKRPSLSPFAQRTAATQRPFCRKTYNPVLIEGASGFSSRENRSVTGFNTSPMRRASRLSLRRRGTVRTSTQETAADEALRSDSYYASLIRLPDELCAAIDDGLRSSGRSRHFVLLTKSPNCDLQMFSDGSVKQLSSNKTTPPIVKLTKEQSDIIWKFIKSPVYVYIYSACFLTAFRLMFRDLTVLLPCWVDQDMDWNIAWDVVEECSSHNAKAAFNRFFWNLAKLKGSSFRLKKFSLDRIKGRKKQQGEGVISEDELLTDSFLDMDALIDGDINSSEDSEKCRQYLSSCTSEVWNQLQWGVPNQGRNVYAQDASSRFYIMQQFQLLMNENRQSPELSSSWQLKDYGVNSSLAPWLVLFVCMPNYTADAVYFKMALKWKESFSIKDEISTSALASTIKRWEDLRSEWPRLAALGNSLLCIMTMVDKFPMHGDLRRYPKGERAWNQVILDTDDFALAQLLLLFIETINTVLGKGEFNVNEMDAYVSLVLGFSLSTCLSYSIPQAKGNDDFSEENSLSEVSSLGKVFKAFIGHYYLQHGSGALWKICKEIGLVKENPKSGFFPDSEEWQEKDPERIEYKKEWEDSEMSTIYFCRKASAEIYHDFTNRIGYTFHREVYFNLGIRVPYSGDYWSAKRYEYSHIIGKAFLDQFFQSFMMKSYPELSQQEIDQIISDEMKTHLYIRLAFNIDLPFRGRGSQVRAVFSVPQDSKVRGLYSFENVDINALQSAKAASQQVAKSMLGMLGYIILDGGFSMQKFNKLIEPLLAEDIKCIVAHDGEITNVLSANCQEARSA